MNELTIDKRCNATIERVFAAWTEPDLMARWFAPGTMSVAEAVADVRVGGAWRVVMQEPSGQRRTVGGHYREVSPHSRLRFSWRWEGSEHTSEVEITLRADGTGTELQLTHRELESATSRDQHGQGWQGCLAKLIEQFA
jgi:uncharacterized protein YndB with AHSA1/START domain